MSSGNKCSKCGQPMPAKQFYRVLSYDYKCGHCGETLTATFGSRLILSVLIVSIILINLLIFEPYDISLKWRFAFYIPYLAVIFLLVPWIITVKVKQGRACAGDGKK